MNTQHLDTTSSLRSLFAAAVAVVALAGPLAAAHADQAPAVRVDYADLNLANTAGKQSLYGRIVAAANRVCGDAQPVELNAKQAAAACREQAIAQAVAQVADPSFLAWYSAKTGHEAATLVARK